MAVTGPESHKSKKSKHKKSPIKTVINNSISGREPEEQDESETDLDKPLFKLPQHHSTVSKSQFANGDVSDSETDIDKPPKRTAFHKSVQEIQNAKSYSNTQSAVQRSDEDEESDDEQQSMSLLQLQPAKYFSEKRSNQSNTNRSPKIGHNSLPASGTLKSKVTRKPSVPEMSPSESESVSDGETNPHNYSQLQRPLSQPESESEEESEEEKRTPETSQINHGTRTVPQPESESESEKEVDEQQNDQSEESRNRQQQQFVSAVDPFARIKEEAHSNSESSSFEEDDPPPLQELQNTSLVSPEASRRISSQSSSTPQNPRGNVINRNHSSDIATFEQEHTRISAPFIDIPQDSRVWVLQVPRSIEAVHLHGQHLPKKLKGGEVLNLPSGRWQIMEQPYEASRSTLNCVVSTGNFSYGMRWLQPRGYWFLKHLRSPLQMETTDAPWTQEITPLPIKELLKMKSSGAISKEQHLKPSKKRHRNSDLDLPSKRTKMVQEGFGMIHQLFVERKRKVQLFNNSSSIVDIEPSMMELSSKKDESTHEKVKHRNHGTSAEEESSIQGGEAEKGKKRKRSSECNEESPKKKKKKHLSEVNDQSNLEDAVSQSQSISADDVNRSMTSARAENISFSRKEKKKSKHKEICDESLKSSPVTIAKVKQEITENDSEWMEHSPLHNVSGSSSGKKQKRHKKRNIEQETEDTLLETRQNESGVTSDREKKKKSKRKSNESEEGETFQANEKKIELASPPNYSMGTEKPIKKEKKHSQQSETSFENTDTEVRKKKKHKHHKNIGEGEVPVQEPNEDISVKKKKKHKHKESDAPKVKQENFWERETSPDFLSHLYLTQATPEDR